MSWTNQIASSSLHQLNFWAVFSAADVDDDDEVQPVEAFLHSKARRLKKQKDLKFIVDGKTRKVVPVGQQKTLFFFVETGFLFVRIWTFGALEQAEGAEENFARASRPKS